MKANFPAWFPLNIKSFDNFAASAILAVVLACCSSPSGIAQQQNASPQVESSAIRGVVVDSAGSPVDGATVWLKEKDGAAIETQTAPNGSFIFSISVKASYTLRAAKGELHSRGVIVASPAQDGKNIRLMLEGSGTGEAMAFADQPDFTVAGVTDWSAVGGHGSDSGLRASEALTRETLALKSENRDNSSSGSVAAANESEASLRAQLAAAPNSFEANQRLGEFFCHEGRYRDAIPLLEVAHRVDPENFADEYDLALAYQATGDVSSARDVVLKRLARKNDADFHRLLGELDEQLGDPLGAVHEEEQAARIDPSEQNYFAWGSELLLHRAVHPAAEVFSKGVGAYPRSARMLAALGAARFAGGLYEEAARSLCDASELNPADAQSYLLLAKADMAAPEPLACVEPKLAAFLRQQPNNALANYYYAMVLAKRQPAGSSQQGENLLLKAVAIDPKFDAAYLQLGILAASQHDLQKAIGFYLKAIEANPQLGEAHYRLGVVYDRTGEPAKAKEQFQLHDEVEKSQAAAVERERKEVRQFLVVLNAQPTATSIR